MRAGIESVDGAAVVDIAPSHLDVPAAGPGDADTVLLVEHDVLDIDVQIARVEWIYFEVDEGEDLLRRVGRCGQIERNGVGPGAVETPILGLGIPDGGIVQHAVQTLLHRADSADRGIDRLQAVAVQVDIELGRQEVERGEIAAAEILDEDRDAGVCQSIGRNEHILGHREDGVADLEAYGIRPGGLLGLVVLGQEVDLVASQLIGTGPLAGIGPVAGLRVGGDAVVQKLDRLDHGVVVLPADIGLDQGDVLAANIGIEDHRLVGECGRPIEPDRKNTELGRARRPIESSSEQSRIDRQIASFFVQGQAVAIQGGLALDEQVVSSIGADDHRSV